MEAELSRISQLPQKDKSQAYSTLLSSLISNSSSSSELTSNLTQYLTSTVVSNDFPQIVARQVLSDYVNQILSSSKSKIEEDRDLKKQVLNKSLEVLQPRVNQFENEICTLRENYADLLEQDEEFPEAAKVLIGIPLESGTKSDSYKLKVYIRIVRLFLEEEDSTSADTYFNRASLLAHSASDDVEVSLQFKLCQARMFDYSRKFQEASSKYHEISYVSVLAEEERLQALSAAIVCAVLAPAGPNRSRILTSLYKDERSSSTSHFKILSKMFLDQMIKPKEVEIFSSNLSSHQLAKLPPTKTIVPPPTTTTEEREEVEVEGKNGPETVLDRAMMEHNVLSCSRVFNSITFSGLGGILGLKPLAAEVMARTMIQQKRLYAKIDQIDQCIFFDNQQHVDKLGTDGIVSNVAQQSGNSGREDEEEMKGKKEEAGYGNATKRWDSQIRQTLQLAESVAARCEFLLNNNHHQESENVVVEVNA
ncbi:hypothetical protein JCM3765_005466 [Sporobolomyces pararoseus]